MRLPVLSARKVVAALRSQGFAVARQSGSHIILAKGVGPEKVTVVVPNHDELARGTLLSIIEQTRMGREAFLSLF